MIPIETRARALLVLAFSLIEKARSSDTIEHGAIDIGGRRVSFLRAAEAVETVAARGELPPSESESRGEQRARVVADFAVLARVDLRQLDEAAAELDRRERQAILDGSSAIRNLVECIARDDPGVTVLVRTDDGDREAHGLTRLDGGRDPLGRWTASAWRDPKTGAWTRCDRPSFAWSDILAVTGRKPLHAQETSRGRWQVDRDNAAEIGDHPTSADAQETTCEATT